MDVSFTSKLRGQRRQLFAQFRLIRTNNLDMKMLCRTVRTAGVCGGADVATVTSGYSILTCPGLKGCVSRI